MIKLNADGIIKAIDLYINLKKRPKEIKCPFVLDIYSCFTCKDCEEMFPKIKTSGVCPWACYTLATVKDRLRKLIKNSGGSV